MNFVSYKDLHDDIYNWTKTLPNDFDIIIGIPRSGMLVSLPLSLHYNIPTSDIYSFKNFQIPKSGHRGLATAVSDSNREIHKIFVVDDSCLGGTAINEAKNLLKDLRHYDIKYGAMYVTEDSKKYLDYFYRVVNVPRCFQWNFMHADIVKNSCCDIDGVLCEPPTSEQNDDGEKYIQFLKNTKSICIPTIKIKYLVTCRLEKYRNLTEEWLHLHNIKYDKLFMMNYNNMQERQKDGKYAEYKADIYTKSNCGLFIEDEIVQAQKISQITNKSVLCVGNWTMY